MRRAFGRPSREFGCDMSMIARDNKLNAYQMVLLNRAVHPELFQLRGRRVVSHASYELEAWIMDGKHLLRFEQNKLCCCELVTDEEPPIPDGSVVEQFFCAGERDYDHLFSDEPVNYITTVQTEQLSENLFASTLGELRSHAASTDALCHAWSGEGGENLSVLDIQRYHREVHVQAYHLLSAGGVVIRSQTIFEMH